MIKITVLILFVAYLSLSQQKITLQQLSQLHTSELSNGDLVEVVEHARSRSLQALSREYYVLKVVHKQKIKAYNNMNKLFEQVLRILVKNKVVPDSNSLVKSKIKPQYLSKRRMWSFSTIFVIFGSAKQLSKCNTQLVRFGIQRLITKPSINFLNQKMLALQVFSSAKARLERQLSRFSDFNIKEVEQIEIEGRPIANSDLLQNQIQQDFSQSEEQIIEQADIKEGNQPAAEEELRMRVIFRVGVEEQQQSEEFYEQLEEDSQHSEDNSENQSV